MFVPNVLSFIPYFQYYRDLTHLNRDGMAFFTNNIQHIISEKYSRLHTESRRQVCLQAALHLPLTDPFVCLHLAFMVTQRNVAQSIEQHRNNLLQHVS